MTLHDLCTRSQHTLLVPNHLCLYRLFLTNAPYNPPKISLPEASCARQQQQQWCQDFGLLGCSGALCTSLRYLFILCVYISKYIYIANSYNSYASDRTFTDNYCAYIHNHVAELAFSHYARASSHYAWLHCKPKVDVVIVSTCTAMGTLAAGGGRDGALVQQRVG